MPRHKVARETNEESLRREIEAAEARCRQEEDEISDAETLDSDYETESTEEEDSYDSDCIDDSEIPSVPAEKWKTFDMRSMEDPTFTGQIWRPYRPRARS